MQNLKEFVAYTKNTITFKEMKAIEINCEALGLSRIKLMESAGVATARFIKKKFSKKKIIFICGKGNNAGDGFVAARHLSKAFSVTVILLWPKDELKTQETRSNFLALEKSNATIVEMSSEHTITRLRGLLDENEVVVDAIFGAGFRGKPDTIVINAIKYMNSSNKKCISIDVPSCMNTEYSVKADFTITYHKDKEEFKKCNDAGKVVIADIGIPVDAEILAGPGDIFLAAKERGEYSDKRENGRMLLIAGSKEYFGAALLASNSAYNLLSSLRTGIGYAIAYLPREVAKIAKVISPNIIVRTGKGENICMDDLELIKKDVDRSDVVAIGMGIGKEDDTMDVVMEILRYAAKKRKRIVADADAIVAVKKINKRLRKNVIITPHDGEFYNVSGVELPKTDISARIKHAIRFANKEKINILLKGHNTIITDGKLLKISRSKTAALATMGTGDVLSGIICAYLNMTSDILEAGTAGAFLHARIGDMLFAEKGNHIIASDVVDAIPKAIKELERELII